MIIDLIYNLSVLLALSVLSGFINSRFDSKTRSGILLQGFLFGMVAIVGMMYPFRLDSQVIFDGRSIVLSLSTLFFGPVAGLISTLMAIAYRINLGGGGALTGSLVSTASFLIGFYFYRQVTSGKFEINKINLYVLGFITSAVMMGLMLTLPSASVQKAFKTITITVMSAYPIITLFIGQILLDHFEKKKADIRIKEEIEKLKEARSELKNALQHLNSHLYNSPIAVIEFDSDSRIVQWSKKATEIFGWEASEVIGKQVPFKEWIVGDDYLKVLESNRQLVSEHNSNNFIVNKNYRKDGKIITCAWYNSALLDTNGKLISYYSLVNDITAEVNALSALKESEQYNRMLFEQTAIGLALTAMDGRLIDINPAYAKILGRTIEETLNLTYWDITPREYFEKENEMIRQLNESGHYGPYEKEYIHKNGHLVPVRLQGLIFHKEGVPHIWSSIVDLTEEKAAEKELRESRERLELFFNQSLDGFFFMMLDEPVVWNDTADKEKVLDYVFEHQRITKVNDAMLEQYGATREQFIGILPKDFYAHDIIYGREVWKKMFDAGKLHIETNERRFDGTQLYVEGDYICLYDSDGRITGHFGIQRDVTARIYAETELKKLYEAVEQSHASVFITDTDAKIQYVNKKALNITGYSREELLNVNPRIIKSGLMEESTYKNLWDTISAGRVWTGNLLNKKKNGEFYWESAQISPIFDETGKITNYLAVKEDITDKVKTEQELNSYRNHLEELVKERTAEIESINAELLKEIKEKEEAQRLLSEALEKQKELNSLKSRFISTASHEFRTPLTTILSSRDLIQRFLPTWSTEKINSHLDRINNAVYKLVHLMDEVITINRADAGKVVLNPSDFNLHSFCKNLIHDTSLNSEIHEIELNYSCSTDTYRLDQKQIELIFQNLLSNAVKYSPKGGRIEVAVKESDENLVIEISDEGIGIPDEDKSGLFETFHRASNVENIAGSGLGLAIVKNAVELHNGTITYESEKGKGTKFTVFIPSYPVEI